MTIAAVRDRLILVVTRRPSCVELLEKFLRPNAFAVRPVHPGDLIGVLESTASNGVAVDVAPTVSGALASIRSIRERRPVLPVAAVGYDESAIEIGYLRSAGAQAHFALRDERALPSLAHFFCSTVPRPRGGLVRAHGALLDLNAQTLVVGGHVLTLESDEAVVLAAMMRNADRPVGMPYLLEVLREANGRDLRERSLRRCIRALRGKLATTALGITVLRYLGYVFSKAPELESV